VKVKIYDDIIHTFDNVRHVPSLKKKLISLGTLDANGYTYSSGGLKLKICNGSIVIMRQEMLYKYLVQVLGRYYFRWSYYIHTGEFGV